MKALIEFVCRAHTVAQGPGPSITLLGGNWAYCEGNASSGHEWMRIEPTQRDHIGDVSQIQQRRAS